jgi:hypothetical protein
LRYYKFHCNSHHHEFGVGSEVLTAVIIKTASEEYSASFFGTEIGNLQRRLSWNPREMGVNEGARPELIRRKDPNRTL